MADRILLPKVTIMPNLVAHGPQQYCCFIEYGLHYRHNNGKTYKNFVEGKELRRPRADSPHWGPCAEKNKNPHSFRSQKFVNKKIKLYLNKFHFCLIYLSLGSNKSPAIHQKIFLFSEWRLKEFEKKTL